MKRNEMFGEDVATLYDRWGASPAESVAQRFQQRMLLDLLNLKWGQSVLDVGCGTGETMRLFGNVGVHATGIDRATAMLAVARRKLGPVPLVSADAAALPFPDASFDAAVMDLTIEFIDNPSLAVMELVRVARRRVYIGIINRWSIYGGHRRIEARWEPALDRRVHFYQAIEILRMLRAAGTTRWRWGSVPFVPNALCRQPVVTLIAGGVAGWPNPFAAYLGFAAEIDRVEAVRAVSKREFRVARAPRAVVARTGLGKSTPAHRRAARARE